MSLGFLEIESFQNSLDKTPWILIRVETALEKQQLSYGARWLDCTDVPSIFFFFSSYAWTHKPLQSLPHLSPYLKLKFEIVLPSHFYPTYVAYDMSRQYERQPNVRDHF